MTKEQASQVVDAMPAEFAVDELVERLLILAAVEKGRQQYREGKTFTQEEVEEQFRERWQP
jgi:predicted transcriptional regulator